MTTLVSNKLFFLKKLFTMSMSVECAEISSFVKTFIPPLTPDLHKGQCGRVGVIGGSLEYTGAPYFSAISALKVGADLVHVFCCRKAAPVIKSYSPELIVHPLLDTVDALDDIKPWLDRLHALVIGPGLGRQTDILITVKNVIEYCKLYKRIPLVIDADGLFLLSQDMSIIKHYGAPIILTPNQMELQRLTPTTDYSLFARSLEVILLQKGESDVIYNGLGSNYGELSCNHPGSFRRCGGQGDLLSGAMAVFLVWCHQYVQRNVADSSTYTLAAYAACSLTRECSRLAYEKHKRSMTTTDMIQEIQTAFENLYG